ncbi:MAG: TIGR00159 family protein [Candidatus Marinimicrobia bacterium]|nr:TIGR00159 family protein [Candidatus Neomarinimicrobiota bacterium]MBT4359683.1 TIGR00159 family protein [Candidatus Neomarinimicrobiota bacterium]MBT4947753.1 TIGR00159 family protein [Candidatus Neomarinimicrobiota bacterium]MBT6012056.1 TIGR00159 family protein [Candidatus Neomarinimicrobiota bacterium]
MVASVTVYFWRYELFSLAFLSVRVYDVVDILAVSFVLYSLYKIFRGTRAAQLLSGILILILLSVIVRWAELHGMSWLLSNLSTVWVIAVVILFQPELRRILIYLGQIPVVRYLFRVKNLAMVGEISDAVVICQERKWGMLIVMEGEVGLKHIKEKSASINARVSAELLVSIFNPTSPLHDGAVIISHEVIESAKCILPLSEEPQGARMKLGTRHLAALGLSEETDAHILVVSEETGTLSHVHNGVMKRGLDEIQLRKVLNNLII